MKSLPLKWRVLGLLAPPLVWADLYTKVLVSRRMYPSESVEVVPGFFNLLYARNRGAAFSLFHDLDPAWSLYFFIGVTLVAASVLVYLFRSIRGRHATLLSLTVTLIASGAVGNFVDRARLGHVIDFLDVYVGTHHWPTFNLADIYISIGAGLLVLYSFFLEPRERKEAEAA